MFAIYYRATNTVIFRTVVMRCLKHKMKLGASEISAQMMSANAVSERG